MTLSRGLIGCLALAAVLSLGGCHHDEASVEVPAGLQQAVEQGVSDLLACLNCLNPLLEVARDPTKAGDLGVSITEVQGEAYAYDFEVPVDIDWDGDSDASITGRIVFSEDPTDGNAPGATASVTWNLTDQGAGVGGSGNFDLEFQADGTVKVLGAGAISETGGEGSFNFVLPAGDPLYVMLEGAGLASRLQVLGPILCALIKVSSGTIEVHLPFLPGGHSFSGTIVLTGNSTEIKVLGGEWDGKSIPNFTFDPCQSATGDPWSGVWILDWDCGGGDTGISTLTIGRMFNSDGDYDYYSVYDQSDLGDDTFTLLVHKSHADYPRYATYLTNYMVDEVEIQESATWTMALDGLSFHKESDWMHVGTQEGGHCTGEAARVQ